MKLHFFSDYSIIIRSMKKVKHILETFIHSFIPQDIYYPKLLHTRFKVSLLYYLYIIAFFSLLLTGVLLFHYSPFKIVGYKNSVIKSLSGFPPEAVISIKNGILESNQIKPLFLWVYDGKQPLFVFMVHTKDLITSSDIPLPLVFLGYNNVQISYRGNILSRTYANSLNIQITKEYIQSLITILNTYFPSFIFFFYLFFVFLVPIAFVASSTFFILLSSFVVLLLLRTFIPHIHLKKCIQAAMHGTHIPLLVSILLYILFPSSMSTIIISTSLIFVFSLVATYEMYSKGITHFKGR